MSYRTAVVARAQTDSATAQSAAIPGREGEMVKNRAGGFVFSVDCWTRLRRFLILGSDSPTYYADAGEMTFSNVDAVLECLRADGLRVVEQIVEVSDGGLAPKNAPALYALALCSAYGVKARVGVTVDLSDRAQALTMHWDPRAAAVREAAFRALPKVARTGTHVMQFVGYMESLRGWGQLALNGVGAWIAERGLENLALQAVKYRQREGWTLRDLLRLSHPRVDDPARRALVDWIVHRDVTEASVRQHDLFAEFVALEARSAEGLDAAASARWEELSAYFIENELKVPTRVSARRHPAVTGDRAVAAARAGFRLVDGLYLAREAMERAAAGAKNDLDRAASAGRAVAAVVRSHSLPREAVPTEALNSADVWDALLVDMPLGAMLRNLPKMTQLGVLSQGRSEATEHVVRCFGDAAALKRARLHPYQILVAAKVYASGHSPANPSSTWTPVPRVVDALDRAFYLAFSAVEPTGLRYVQAFDVSGSMATAMLSAGKDRFGRPVHGPISARVASVAMGMVVGAVEPCVRNVGFTGFHPGGRYSNIGTAPPRGAWLSTNDRDSGDIRNCVSELDISHRRRIDDVCKYVDGLSMGRTDCALPMLYAMEKGIEADVFVIYTDNETWAGKVHPAEALRMYRRQTGIPAKLVAVAMTATEYSVADKSDRYMLDVVGFDADAPAIIADFVRS